MRPLVATLALCCATSNALAEEAEVVMGATPITCQSNKAARPPSPHPGGAKRVGTVLTWLAAHTCRQYLVPKGMLSRIVQLDPQITAEELERSLSTVLATGGLTSQAYAVVRIAEGGAITPPTPDPEPAAIDLGIRCRGSACTIPRASVDRLLGDTEALARSCRIVPAFRDGKPFGFKFYAIRPGSVWSQLGFQNGDTMLSVNGDDVSSPDKALEIYTKLRGVSKIVLTLERHSAPLVLDIQITAP